MGIQPHLNTSHLKEVGDLNQELHERSKDCLYIRALMFYLLPSALEPSAFQVEDWRGNSEQLQIT